MKRYATIIITLVLAIAYGTRLYFVNVNADRYEVEYIPFGEVVDLGESYFYKKNSIDMYGYTVKINNSYTKTLKEMVEEYGYQMSRADKYIDYFYILEVEFKNESSENPYEYSGINLNGHPIKFCVNNIPDELNKCECDKYFV